MAMSQRRWQLEQERKRRERMRRQRRRRNCAIVVLLLAIIAVVAIIMINNGESRPIDKGDKETPVASVKTDIAAAENPYTTTRSEDDIKTSFFTDSAFAGNALAEAIGTYGILRESDFYAGVNIDVENVYTAKTFGSTTSVAEQFKSKRFKKVFLSFGEREMASLSSTAFKDSYIKLIDKIEEYQPNARIYLIGIPPVTAQTSEEDGVVTMKKIKEYNRRIMSIAVDEELYYIDSVDALGDNKDFLPMGVSKDGINLNKSAVIDLLYYIQKEAYIPDMEDLTDSADEDDIEEDDDEEEEEAIPTKKPQKADSASPSPTVNVLKDSSSTKRTREE